jgi:hypothetical protein
VVVIIIALLVTYPYQIIYLITRSGGTYLKAKSTICHWAKRSSHGCDTCGSGDFNKPCYVKVPDYIPNKQISKFIDIKMERKNV